ncbi:prepilin-type N-terminal cleavage/methylation domain-containing protein, partial [Candidatus Microgenomates bacterium]|nr:prepilin-type N-terminal cleavage/methylation domain-containing protein [Candidatus Microgenomates bacterium]
MKKFLPIKSSGFTLIELLVVVAILAVLAVMGFAAFGGLTGRGNDDRRSVDMKAFADAMEVKRANNAVYVAISATDFAT